MRARRDQVIGGHGCKNNHDYKILIIFEEKLMQQVMFDYNNVFFTVCIPRVIITM